MNKERHHDKGGDCFSTFAAIAITVIAVQPAAAIVSFIILLIYLFPGSYHVGLSCHDIQATQGARKSGVYLIHPPNLAQGPWRVYCDLESEGGGWIVFQGLDSIE